MHLKNLPESERVGAAADTVELAKLLQRAVGNSRMPFVHTDRILGASRSGRILFQERIASFTQTLPLDQPMTAETAAEEFFHPELMKQVRYDPAYPASVAAREGWEVFVSRPNGKVMVIVWAAWLE